LQIITSPSRRRLARTLLAGALFALFGACDQRPKFKSADVTGAEFGRVLALSDHEGMPRTLEDFRGKLVLLFFGYTQCPDVCPLTLADTAQALKSLGAKADRVQVLFVTLDPERDTADVLRRYVPAFDSRFIGLRGNPAETERAAKEFKVFFEKRPGAKPGEYTVDHSAQTFVLDARGRLRLFVRQDRIVADLADDLRTLLDE
jgi:protein SCO1/2